MATPVQDHVPASRAEPSSWSSRARQASRWLSLSRVSGVYVWLALILGFSLWLPSLFPTVQTFRTIASSQSITGIVTLGLVITLAAGTFDLSVGYTIGVSGIVTAKLLIAGQSVWLSVLVGLAVALLIGAANAIVVVGIGIDSFIATLATGSVLQAVAVGYSNNNLLTGFPNSFGRIGNAQILGIPATFVYLIVLAVIAWYVLVHTPFGRQLYALGKGPEAARLAGIRTRRYAVIALLCTAAAAGIAGILLTSQVGSVSADQGVSFLLPGYAAAFLGATQIQPGRPNVWGSVLATFLLATGVTGLQLSGASSWVPYLFNGIALIVAVGLGLARDRVSALRLIRVQRRRAGSPASTTPANASLAGPARVGSPTPEPSQETPRISRP